jgi:hypothetical protein
LIAHAGFDLVGIITLPALHAEMTMPGLDAGKHALCEKQFAMSALENEKLRDVATSSVGEPIEDPDFVWLFEIFSSQDAYQDGHRGSLPIRAPRHNRTPARQAERSPLGTTALVKGLAL